jgi:glucosamine--fructose-6-phosphate aminotransferase (isomerizing)
VARLEGAYALAAIDWRQPDEVVAARSGSPLVVGVGIGEHFLASDTWPCARSRTASSISKKATS